MSAAADSLIPRHDLSPPGLCLHITGTVQGVGMRPHVYRLAQRFDLRGDVCNSGGEVIVRIWGTQESIDAFVATLRQELPPGGDLRDIRREILHAEPPSDFSVRGSDPAPAAERGAAVAVVPDRAVCTRCLAEMHDARNARFHYPFTNCTDCGPRYTILRAQPWDRNNTAMAGFTLCASCLREYHDPADRRFHAQPNACPRCGPRVRLSGGDAAHQGDAALFKTAELIAAGHLVAIQGLGCFHLACAATNDMALRRLRECKQRPEKALALMAADLDQVARFARVGEAESALLASAPAPIVLLDKSGEALPEAVSPQLNRLGFMLPNTPLHHILFQHLRSLDFDAPIVLTSANEPGGAPLTDARAAIAQWQTTCAGVLHHDRAIVNRADDSVAQIVDGRLQLLRRARGYAPRPQPLPAGFRHCPPILALGGHIKNSFCLLNGDSAVLSPWIGDLDSTSLREDFRRQLDGFCRLHGFAPTRLTCDQHPDYFSSREAERIAQRDSLPLHRVWHHHAHAAACLAENGRALDAAPILAIIFDGTGLGPDGTLWGGEFLLADYRSFVRMAHLGDFPLPGGELAARQPWRCLWSQLDDPLLTEFAEVDVVRRLQQDPYTRLRQLAGNERFAPRSSSVGRLFDAVAAALSISFDAVHHEGEAAMKLQSLAECSTDTGCYDFGIDTAQGTWQLDTRALWHQLLADLRRGCGRDVIARRFHLGLAQASVAMACRLFEATGGWREPVVALSGGVFQNRLLAEAMAAGLRRQGFEVLQHGTVPANDSGLSLGQALVAAAQYSMTAERGR